MLCLGVCKRSTHADIKVGLIKKQKLQAALQKLSTGLEHAALQNDNLQVDGHVGTIFGGGCVCRCIHVVHVSSEHVHTLVLLPVCGAKTIVIERLVAQVLRTCPSLLFFHISTVRVCLGWMTSAGLRVEQRDSCLCSGNCYWASLEKLLPRTDGGCTKCELSGGIATGGSPSRPFAAYCASCIGDIE